MAVANLVCVLSVDNSCVKASQQVNFQLTVNNTTGSVVNITDIHAQSVSQGGVGPGQGAGLPRLIPINYPFPTQVAANGSANYAFQAAFPGAMPVLSVPAGSAVPQVQVQCVVSDASNDVIASNTVNVSVYPPTPPNVPPTIPQSAGIGNPPMPTLGQAWFESNLCSGTFAALCGVV